MTHSRIAAWTCVALFSAAGVAAAANMMSREEYKAEKDRIDAEYKAAKQRCDGMSGNAKDICMAEIKGEHKVSLAELDARQKGTPKAREKALEARADADYDVAKQECDNKSGNDKDVCLKDAKAKQTRAKADAKAARKTSNARKEASKESRHARYEAAKERCDAMSGDAKDRCIADAKARYRVN
jgi:hypothetical protein